MKTTTTGALTQLTFLPHLMPMNCYLVEEEDGLTLIDCAMPFSAKPIMQAAAVIGKPITRIVLTHAHGDHIGALDLLKQQLPQVKVYISARDARLLRGDRSLDANEPQQPIKGSVPKQGAIRTVPDVELQPGDKVGSLTVISTPGHTPGHIALWQESSRTLIAGDAMQTRGGMAVAGKMQLRFPFPAMATWSKEEAVASAKRLLALLPELLAIGHGAMVRQPAQAMAAAIAVAERALPAAASAQGRIGS
ncbi:glyoxylase-like metal-dependent hydrolase (beta-lactamase superfamily II) [Paenibacillus cellulosilyticus]|uniref:Glyoxylase-like metal-dependent hydrolase (Beta-lactamase superfamily II) n=1 Tax=Paenibacillus cellulosilyticus TaxID=375489 RepID=A0A2V2YLQ1_9BACL|nr:MBL fold metallo-hydrolase [Paenibacillus cellulosilyticus]PWV95174.1 glyoxylase-like metal-dependent hydrolase (beta-lactamase superfamily II) [Paenibacillus cellulosilyticus]QKS46072.1 MBL fold metallo-hydrolase [Paenibacillus cellulosilyticus]